MHSNASSKPSVLPYKELEESVWKKDICAGCRACITVCPGNTLAFDGKEHKPYQFTPCVDCKACLEVCPRTPANYAAFRSTEIIGPYLDIKSARAGVEVERAQNGGVVTALLTAALEEGLVDCALVMGSDRWIQKAHPMIAYYPEDLSKAAGSKYDSNGVLEALKTVASDDSIRSVAVVGTPCAIQSIGLLRASTNEYAMKLAKKVRFAIGLFCFEVFDDAMVEEVSKRLGVPTWRITKMNAGEGKMTVTLRGGEVKQLPLSSLGDYVRKGCKVCPDFTSKSADISVGSVGSKPGLSTVIVRSAVGLGLFEIALDMQFIETVPGVDSVAIEKVGKLKLKRNGLQ
ncbi:Coenzyme F420 hydrogenase/dehydrogenase, beta subunit C-terminal domain [Methanocella sp. MCL-LM]|uniref:Coenzyme F420 hydrogenase/dehydrogenase, beta subunit C-terminal domain n=1 Tax=Methanocella sp. MCL-LM TaxID=3412035 RepID=UPI003C77462E